MFFWLKMNIPQTVLLTFLAILPNEILSLDSNPPVVKIQDGKVKGKIEKNYDNENYYQFLGIPYGKPPVNELRFKPPEPAESWNGVRDATKIGNASISRDDLTGEIIGSEDCLYLNVFTKELPTGPAKLRPVMVFIHGGGFTLGSSRPGVYGPDFLMIKDIVLVTFNYRLGVLGFLAFDDPSLGITGNMGLKDQTLALKWVKRNIAFFGGNPNDVTLFGESSGAASVHGHILSPLSKGLFHKAILQSGCALNSFMWGSKNNAREIVKQLGKSAKSEKEALQILKDLSGMEIYNAQEKMLRNEWPYVTAKREFAAVIEIPNNVAFFTESPLETIKKGNYNRVPLMMGYTKTEGMTLDLAKMLAAVLDGRTLPELTYEELIPFQLNVTKGSPDSIEISKTLEKLYSNISDERKYHEITDSVFLVGMMETIRLELQSKTPIYLYRMSLEGQLNFLKRVISKLDQPGTAHADDLGYLFHMDITPDIKPGSLEDRSVRKFVELWTDFTQYRDVTPDDLKRLRDSRLKVLWKPVESMDDIKLLDIGDQLVFIDFPERNRLETWWKILEKWPIVKFD